MDTLSIVSVNTGQLELVGMSPGGHEVYSGFRKAPVLGGTPIKLTELGLEGDQQTEHLDSTGKRIHGGVEKALYFYPREHLGRWVQDLGYVVVPGDFGENVTVDGPLEADVYIGDRWRWGDAVVEVTSPRRPCAKLTMLRGPDAARIMMATGRCGWYCKVITPGIVPTVGELQLLSRRIDTPSISEAFRAKISRSSAVPALREDEV